MYDRNRGTMEELSRRGFRIVEAEDLLLGREEVDLDMRERVCISFASHELSRARGGPHCLTHPLLRDPWKGDTPLSPLEDTHVVGRVRLTSTRPSGSRALLPVERAIRRSERAEVGPRASVPR